MRDYRYASTMGTRYSVPTYFYDPAEAFAHERMCKRLIGGLPGQDSMRVEKWNGTKWEPVSETGQ